ncbi:MAG: YbdD/YjiX family protein [Gemmatimonadales bacterium]|nr:YbdD/YjiX family protein [Gemmatimonadales bacterium]
MLGDARGPADGPGSGLADWRTGGPVRRLFSGLPSALPPVRLSALIRRISGMPDYATYVAHRLERHPGEPVLTEAEFYDDYLRARYGAPGARCC